MSVGEPALRELDYSPLFGWKPPLRVKGAKVNLQTKAFGKGQDIQSKPSRIPRAVRMSECLSSDNARGSKTTGAQNGVIARRKVVKQGSAVKQLQSLQRRGNVEGWRGSGVQGKVTATGVARNVKMKSVRDEVKQVPKKVHKKRGTVMGKKVQEKTARQLFLSRKYSAKWGRKVFGRVLPSTARRHYCTQLLRRQFNVWSELWWSARREWKLNIRAECHIRYRLWMLVWKNWTEFVGYRKQRRTIEQSATSHNENRLKRTAWGGWCDYQRRRRERKVSQEAAKQWHLSRILRCGWVRWRHGLQRKRDGEVMVSIALQHWAARLQTKAWVCWIGRYRESTILQQKTVTAERHWVTRQEVVCWRAWILYTEHRKRKNHMKRLARKRCHSTLLMRYLAVWQHRLERTRQLAEFQQLVAERGVRAVKRRTFSLWRHYMELELYSQHQTQVATTQYHTTLKSKALMCLRDYCRRQQLQAASTSTAQQFHGHKIFEHGWRVWLQRCEHCEEIKMLPLTRRARQHFRLCALKRVFPGWKAFVELRRYQKVQIALADQHFKSTALPRCFAILQNYSALRRYKREMRGQAQSFRQENLLSMVFYKWWRVYHLSQDVHTLERVAILHSEKAVKRSTLRVWRVRLRHRVRQLSREHSAVVHHQTRLLSIALQRWRDRRQSRVVASQHMMRALHHYLYKFKRKVWAAWTKYVQSRRENHTRCKYGIGHYHTVLLHRTWKGWKTYHYSAVRKNEKRTRAHRFYSLSLKRHTLEQWWENVQFHKLQRDLTDTALTHFEKRTYFKYFEVWKQKTTQSLEIAQREREQAQEVATMLRRAQLVRVLASWREHTNSSMARRIGKERAAVHWNRRVLWKCLTAWRNYRQLSLRKTLLFRQCAYFNRSRLVSTFYAKWRIEFMGAVAMKQRSVLALWHWSQHLQRKALVCWLLYTMNRKRKAERYAQALQRHRNRLIQIGVTQWIEFAASMESQRMESALKHQAQMTEKTMQCVRRCIHHWRSVTRLGKRTCLNTLTRRTSYSSHSAEHRQTNKDIWAGIARKLHIPDSPAVHRRPQPRRPNYLRHINSRDPGSDLAPRLNVPYPHAPPVLYGRQQQQNREGEGLAATHSFTFLPSTCSAPSSLGHQSQLTTTEHPHQPLCTAASTVKHSSQHPTPLPHPVLLPPSAFQKPRPPLPLPLPDSSTQFPTPVTSIQEKATLNGISAAGKSVTSGAAASLSVPALRSHIVHVRNELRKYHEMKAKQKTLEEQMAQSSDGQSAAFAELEVELNRTVEAIHRTEPLLLDMVAQVRELISENHDNN